MITVLLHLLRLFPFVCGGPRQLALENLALRQQLAVYRRTATRPKLRRTDRLFWVWLARVWAGWRQPLPIVTPATVLRWQCRRFREHWTKLSGQPRVGRPPINAEIAALGESHLRRILTRCRVEDWRGAGRLPLAVSAVSGFVPV